MLERARVLFPAIVTEWKSEVFLLNVIVAPSVSAVRVPLILAIAGVVRVLFVRVTVALFLVASLVLSTFPSHTSPFTIPVGVVIAGLVRVLFVSVCVAVVPTTC